MWTIQLMGGVAVRSPERQITRFRTQKAASLLASLAYHAAPGSRPLPRETLIDMLWPDAEPEVGRHNLSNALSFLRSLLEPPGVPPGAVIVADRSSVRLNPAAVLVDVVEFEKDLRRAAAEQLPEAERMAALLAATERYTGPLLPGMYEAWIAPEALRIDSLFAHAAGQLTPMLLRAGMLEPALDLAQRATTADPLSEEATHQLMRVLAAMGMPTQALRAYRRLEARLREELDAPPGEALSRFALNVRAIAPEPPAPAADQVAMEAPRTHDRPHAPAQPGRMRGAEFMLRTTTRFFGRQQEIAQLIGMLSTPRTRLVTVVGPGGTGKTRLAVEVGAELLESPRGDAPASAVFVSLADVAEPERILDAIASALGCQPAPGRAPIDRLEEVLASADDTLLVIDNFEQLVAEGALYLRDLLARTPVKLLVTSRQMLDLDGEHVFHLAPLPVTAGAVTVEELSDNPSIALFVDRAQAALPDFRLSERNAGTVAQLCDRLEGIPLAIELAAARVAVLSPARILEQASANRLDFLASRRRGVTERHRTLRATLDWSYRLLPAAAQRFLRFASVFRGGWTLEAAQDVCAAAGEDALEQLTGLRDSSLVGVADAEHGLRFSMLDTVREYAAELLERAGEQGDAYTRHRQHLVAFVEDLNAGLSGEDERLWLALLEAEHENVRGALERCRTDSGSHDDEIRLAAGLWRYWWARGHWTAAREHLLEALHRPEAAASTRVRARALLGAGVMTQSQGAYSHAAALFEECLAICRELNDMAGVADALRGIAGNLLALGDRASARQRYEESLAIYTQLGESRSAAFLQSLLGDMGVELGDHCAVDALFQAAERQPVGREAANWLSRLASAAKDRGDLDAARVLLEKAAMVYEQLGDRSHVVYARHQLGVVAEQAGDRRLARRIYLECLQAHAELGDRLQVAWTQHGLGFLAYCDGDLGAAQALFSESLTSFREIGHAAGILRSLDRIAGLAVSQGNCARAAALLSAADAYRAKAGTKSWAAQVHEQESYLASARSELDAETFEAAWETGQALSLSAAAGLALAPG